MRLYRMHDLDLMYLYKMPNISIQSIVKVMLKNYIKDRNEGGHIATRLSIPNVEHDIPLPKTAQFHITLIDGEDDDVISWIEQIPKGMRNSMLKNMLRTYLSFPIVTPYETEVTEIAKPTNKNNISIEKYNEVMENSVKKGKRGRPKKQATPVVDKKPVIDDVMDTPLNTETTPEVKEAITSGNDVLNTQPKIEHTEPTKQTIKENAEMKTDNNTPKIDATPKQDTKPSVDDVDLFDDFESMMEKF